MMCHKVGIKVNLRAFSLIEMLVATVLAAVLMSAVLAMLAGVSRDRQTLKALNAGRPEMGFVELLRWDLANARSIAAGASDQSITMVGLGGIDAASLSPNGRLVQISYQLRSKNLWRIQEYLDDSARPRRWVELVAADVSEFSLDPAPGTAVAVPSRLRLRLVDSSLSLDQMLWIK